LSKPVTPSTLLLSVSGTEIAPLLARNGDPSALTCVVGW
jgi:hypothetical protein